MLPPKLCLLSTSDIYKCVIHKYVVFLKWKLVQRGRKGLSDNWLVVELLGYVCGLKLCQQYQILIRLFV